MHTDTETDLHTDTHTHTHIFITHTNTHTLLLGLDSYILRILGMGRISQKFFQQFFKKIGNF